MKQTDFAIGQFLREDSRKIWYKKAVLVIVTDHCASVAGKADLPVQKYSIPLIVYTADDQVLPRQVTSLISHWDYAPTLFGHLNWTHASRFSGMGVRHATEDRRALIGNYQRLGLYEPGLLSLLTPHCGVDHYQYHPTTSPNAPETGPMPSLAKP